MIRCLVRQCCSCRQSFRADQETCKDNTRGQALGPVWALLFSGRTTLFSNDHVCRLQLMVAEKKGTIRFYDLMSQQAILSLDCGQSPLMSADWCLTNTIKVGAVAGNDWLIWDIAQSR